MPVGVFTGTNSPRKELGRILIMRSPDRLAQHSRALNSAVGLNCWTDSSHPGNLSGRPTKLAMGKGVPHPIRP